MAERTGISWCDATFNPWRGCTKVSAGCAHCYADTLSKRNPLTLGVWGPSGTRVVAAESAWREPLKWDRLAAEGRLPDGSPNPDGHRPRVFCASLADVFEDWPGDMHLPNGDVAGREVAGGGVMKLTMGDVRKRLFSVIHRTPNLDWLLVTKRPENAAEFLTDWYFLGGVHDAHILAGRPKEPPYLWCNDSAPKWPWPNVWLGASVENQEAADTRIPALLAVPAAVRFLSMEPLLGPVRLGPWPTAGIANHTPGKPPLDWVIIGGESGHGARGMNVEWASDIRRQCRKAGVAVFVKQLGERPFRQSVHSGNPVEPVYPLTVRGKGGDIEEFPADLRVREFPTTTEG